jgi:hypothetical protein
MKKEFITSLVLALGLFVVAPAVADTLYDNGPVNGQLNAWDISSPGKFVANSFVILREGDTLGDFLDWAWMAGFGNWVEDWTWKAFTTGGIMVGGGTTTPTQGSCFGNEFGYQVCQETTQLGGLQLAAGTYYLTLQDAVSGMGDPVYWDENDGLGCMSGGCPSTAYNQDGPIGSEAFVIEGGSPAPEPGSIFLLGSSLLGAAGILRRKLLG